MPLDAREALLDLLIILQPYFLPNVDDTCARNISEARVVVAPLCDLLKTLSVRDDQALPKAGAPIERVVSVLRPMVPIDSSAIQRKEDKRFLLDHCLAPAKAQMQVPSTPLVHYIDPRLSRPVQVVPLASLPWALRANVPPAPPLPPSPPVPTCMHPLQVLDNAVIRVVPSLPVPSVRDAAVMTIGGDLQGISQPKMFVVVQQAADLVQAQNDTIAYLYSALEVYRNNHVWNVDAPSWYPISSWHADFKMKKYSFRRSAVEPDFSTSYVGQPAVATVSPTPDVCSASFEAWAIPAIDNVLATHGGCMHFHELQKIMVKQYFFANVKPTTSQENQVGQGVLALIPESYLSDADSMVRLSQQDQRVAVAPAHSRDDIYWRDIPTIRMKRYCFRRTSVDPNGAGVAHDCNQQ